MIELTKLSNEPIWINPHLIRSLESTPDSILCLTDGARIAVRESADKISQKMKTYWQSIYSKTTSLEESHL